MAENFLDNVVYAGSTLGVSGDAIAIGSTNAGAKSIIFATSNTVGHLAWLPTANRTINLPDAGGTVMLTSQAILSISAGGARATSGEVIFSNSNNVSFGLNGQTVTASATFAQTAQTQSNIQAVFDGANSISTGTIRFTNANGVSFSVNGQTISASIATSLTNVNVSAGTTSNNLSAFVFSNSNNVSFGLNGSTVTATISVPAQTNQTVGLYALGNTTQNSSTTLDARTISFNGLGAATVGYSNGSVQISVPVQTAQTQSLIQAIYDGANSITTGTIRFTNANGVSFSINGQTISGSVAAQTNQTEGLYAIGNTTGQSSSSTFDARTLSISGAGIASVGYSGNALVISVPTGAPSPVNFSAGTTSGNLGSVVFSNSNGVSFGLNGSTITASVAAAAGSLSLYALGNTTQNSSSVLANSLVSFNALGAMTMGYSNGSIQVSAPPTSSLSATGGVSISTNGSTISIGASQFGTAYDYEVYQFMGTASSNFSGNTGTSGGASFFPFVVPMYVAAQHINVVQSLAFLTVGTSKGSQTVTNSWGLYTRGTGTNSSTIGTITSNSFSIGISGSNSTYTINQPTTSNATGYGTGSTTSAGVNISSGYTGFKLVQFQINSTLSPGNYWLGIFQAISTSSINLGLSISFLGVGRVTGLQNIAPIGSFSSAFSAGAASGNNNIGNWYLGMGTYTSANQTNLPASVALTAISFSAAGAVSVWPHMKLVGTI